MNTVPHNKHSTIIDKKEKIIPQTIENILPSQSNKTVSNNTKKTLTCIDEKTTQEQSQKILKKGHAKKKLFALCVLILSLAYIQIFTIRFFLKERSSRLLIAVNFVIVMLMTASFFYLIERAKREIDNISGYSSTDLVQYSSKNAIIPQDSTECIGQKSEKATKEIQPPLSSSNDSSEKNFCSRNRRAIIISVFYTTIIGALIALEVARHIQRPPSPCEVLFSTGILLIMCMLSLIFCIVSDVAPIRTPNTNTEEKSAQEALDGNIPCSNDKNDTDKAVEELDVQQIPDHEISLSIAPTPHTTPPQELLPPEHSQKGR